MLTNRVTEGTTSFEIPVQDEEASFPAASGPVFYNTRMELNRDATVLLIRVLELAGYLDTMGATGVRGLRVANECGVPVTINDQSSRAVDLIRKNADTIDPAIRVTRCDANVLLSSERFDCVDLDPFGTPAPFIDAAARSAKRFLFVTATDTAPLCGAHRKAGTRRYFSHPLNTEYHAEVGLRVLLGFVTREVVKYDRGLVPLFCFASHHFIRLHLGLREGAEAADRALSHIGYIHQCPACPYREEQQGVLPEPVTCPRCGARLIAAGPLWLGGICDRDILSRMAFELPGMTLGTTRELSRLITLCREEYPSSSFYDYHHLAKSMKVSPPQMETFLGRIREQGFTATRTHFSGTGLKTDAPLDIILGLMKNE
jgi:tRNA (guanine26-N2/guanine27-N2)-dimethyltransferase